MKKTASTLLLMVAWLVGAPAAQGQVTATEGFVVQVLEPTGGKILRPKGWFYREDHGGPSYRWILSREDSSKGPYTTGVRIQVLMGVQEGTKQSPEAFVEAFVASKQSEAKRVLRACEASDQGMFMRKCLETEEGPFRILYSLFWSDSMDIVVVTFAGTKKELWSTYAAAFERMEAFELIDMKRFSK